MFQFPSPPDTLVTRQVECVCCRELFTVSEDVVNLTPSLSEFWRMAPDQYTDIRQRFDPRIGRKPIIPETRAEPQSQPHPILHQRRSQRAHINCPRCGADNRNWVHITEPPQTAVSFRQNTWWRRFPVAIIGLVIGIMIVCAGVLLAHLSGQSKGQSLLLLVMATLGSVVVPTFALTVMWRGQRLHEIEAKQDKTRSFFQRISPAIKTSLAIFSTTVVFLPIFIYGLMPWAINRLRPTPSLEDRIDQTLVILDATINTATQQDKILLENTVFTLQSILNEREFDCQAASINTMIHSLEALQANLGGNAYDILLINTINSLRVLRDSGIECRSDLLQNAIASLRILSECREPECKPPNILLPGCGKGLSSTMDPATTIQMTTTHTPNNQDCYYRLLYNMIFQLTVLDEPPINGELYIRGKYALEGNRWLALTSSNKDELALISKQVGIIEKISKINLNGRSSDFHAIQIWILIAGAANILATGFAIIAIESFIGHINHHLPRPIGNSIASMTKVVIRDLRHALDIPDESLRQIEWTQVERKRNGGINLKGIFLPPDEAIITNATYVRTQCCIVSTDQWGKITHADIHYCRIPKLAVHPGRRTTELSIFEADLQNFFLQQRNLPREDVTI